MDKTLTIDELSKKLKIQKKTLYKRNREKSTLRKTWKTFRINGVGCRKMAEIKREKQDVI